MYSQKDLECPVCHEHFKDDDDIVVCPVCGAPHHRECWNKTGHCQYESTHGTPEQWKRPEKPEPEPQKNENNSSENNTNQADSRIICPRCRTLNDNNAQICMRCGYPLHENANNYGQPFQNSQPNGQFPPMFVYDPYGGVDPKSKIDDVPVADIAAFVGSNSAYYIPKFKKMKENKHSISFNFSACILGPFWFIFRKMFIWGLIFLVLLLAVRIPDMISSMTPEIITGLESQFGIDLNNTVVIPAFLQPIFWGVSLLLHILWGFIGNRVYMGYVLKKVKKLSEDSVQNENIDQLEYQKALLKNGNANMALGLLAFLIYYLIQMIIVYIVYY